MLGAFYGALPAGTMAVEPDVLAPEFVDARPPCAAASGSVDADARGTPSTGAPAEEADEADAYDGNAPTLGVVGFGGTGTRDFSLLDLLGAHARNAPAMSASPIEAAALKRRFTRRTTTLRATSAR